MAFLCHVIIPGGKIEAVNVDMMKVLRAACELCVKPSRAGHEECVSKERAFHI